MANGRANESPLRIASNVEAPASSILNVNQPTPAAKSSRVRSASSSIPLLRKPTSQPAALASATRATRAGDRQKAIDVKWSRNPARSPTASWVARILRARVT
jgi:hypothetical protein